LPRITRFDHSIDRPPRISGGSISSFPQGAVNLVETLRAAHLHDGLYRLSRVQLHAYRNSEDGVVKPISMVDWLPVSPSIAAPYCVFLPDPKDEEEPLWERFPCLGCTCERVNTRLIAIEAPERRCVCAMYAVLEREERRVSAASSKGIVCFVTLHRSAARPSRLI
jgi:hypothetical protein